MTAHILHPMPELHGRGSDGIHVRLLWSEHEGPLAVAVADTKKGDVFAVEIREGDHPLDVFHHPYAYAAWRGVGAGGPRCLDGRGQGARPNGDRRRWRG